MPCKCFVFKVIRAGFEPTTHSLEGCCSIQLSYRTLSLYKRLQKYTNSENKKNLCYSKLRGNRLHPLVGLVAVIAF